jgi:putative endonuclease
LTSKKYQRHQFGKFAEEQVSNYLQQHGLQLVVSNYSCKLGEIDIIMRDQDCLVFVEVRARVNQDFLMSLESVNRSKQHKIINTATYYLQSVGLLNKMFCRFDVVVVQQQEDELKFHWVKNAFE